MTKDNEPQKRISVEGARSLVEVNLAYLETHGEEEAVTHILDLLHARLTAIEDRLKKHILTGE